MGLMFQYCFMLLQPNDAVTRTKGILSKIDWYYEPLGYIKKGVMSGEAHLAAQLRDFCSHHIKSFRRSI